MDVSKNMYLWEYTDRYTAKKGKLKTQNLKNLDIGGVIKGSMTTYVYSRQSFCAEKQRSDFKKKKPSPLLCQRAYRSVPATIDRKSEFRIYVDSGATRSISLGTG